LRVQILRRIAYSPSPDPLHNAMETVAQLVFS